MSLDTTLSMSLDEAEAVVREALRHQGFGVLTEIDVAATLKEKLGIERNALKILGACNPGFAHRALEIDPTASLLLPCNVVLETVGDSTRVAIADPRALMPGDGLAALAGEAAAQLEAVIAELQAGPTGH